MWDASAAKPDMLDDLKAEALAGGADAAAAVDRVLRAVRRGLREPPFSCARCGAVGEFYEAWHICEDCVRAVHMQPDAAAAVEWLLRSLGQDTAREGLSETPRRVAKSLREMFAREPFAFTAFDAEKTDEMVVQSGITFSSLCEHHMLPFVGTATVGYIPDGRIVGLSKLARAVRYCAAGLQNQERITRSVAEMIAGELKPLGVGVVLRAEHMCMTIRGVKAPGALTTTSCMLGSFLQDARCRAEFVALAKA